MNDTKTCWEYTDLVVKYLCIIDIHIQMGLAQHQC